MATTYEWTPTEDEVQAILAEMRPMITDIARRQRDELSQLRPPARFRRG